MQIDSVIETSDSVTINILTADRLKPTFIRDVCRLANVHVYQLLDVADRRVFVEFMPVSAVVDFANVMPKPGIQ